MIRVYLVGMIVLYYSARISTCGGSLLFWEHRVVLTAVDVIT